MPVSIDFPPPGGYYNVQRFTCKLLLGGFMDDSRIVYQRGEEIFSRLTIAAHNMKKAFFPLAKKYGLASGEIGLMMILYRRPDLDSAAKITGRLGATKGFVSRCVLSLTRKNLITCTPDEEDKRIVRLALSGRGEEICRQVARIKQNLYKNALKDIPCGDVEKAMALVEKIADNIEKSVRRGC